MSSVRKILCVIFVFIVFEDGEMYQDSNGQCNTPDRKSGKCIAVVDCKPMLNFITGAPKPVSDEVKEKLNDYVCGFVGGAVQICCPSEPIELDHKKEPEVPPPPPDVINHKNVNLLPEDCGLIDTGDKIRNGINAGLREFPWMALLAYNTSTGPQFKCGGTIINERYILTAAHCLVGTAFPLISVRVGEYDLSSKEDCADDHKKCRSPIQDVSVEKIIYPSDYNISLYANDIGLVRVSKIDFKPANIWSVCLPITEGVRNQEFATGVVTGWGFKDAYGTTTDILQKVDLPTQPISACINAYKVQPDIKLSYRQLCIGGTENKDSCRGDSGGPFHTPAYFNEDHRYVQQGVVSIGPSFCGTIGFPGIYTRVTYYMPWILDNIKP